MSLDKRELPSEIEAGQVAEDHNVPVNDTLGNAQRGIGVKSSTISEGRWSCCIDRFTRAVPAQRHRPYAVTLYGISILGGSIAVITLDVRHEEPLGLFLVKEDNVFEFAHEFDL